MTTEEMFKQLLTFIEENTTWESYGYYGPLIYTGPLLNEISRLQEELK